MQRYINTVLPEEPDSDELLWPSDPEGRPISMPPVSEPDSSSPESWGIFGAPVRPADNVLFGGSENPPPSRPQPTPQPAVVQQQPAASSSSDPAPALGELQSPHAVIYSRLEACQALARPQVFEI